MVLIVKCLGVHWEQGNHQIQFFQYFFHSGLDNEISHTIVGATLLNQN